MVRKMIILRGTGHGQENDHLGWYMGMVEKITILGVAWHGQEIDHLGCFLHGHENDHLGGFWAWNTRRSQPFRGIPGMNPGSKRLNSERGVKGAAAPRLKSISE